MAKAQIDKEQVEHGMVESMLRRFDFPLPLREFAVLYGGYSGTSIKVVAEDGTHAVLKVCHGYGADDVEATSKIAVHARSNGFGGMCTALPRRDAPAGTFTASREDGATCCLLSWVGGKAADKVVSDGTVPAADVLSAVGAGLAKLHSVPVSPADAAGMRQMETGGACDVHKHLSGEIHALFTSSEVVKGHEFLPFYEQELEKLREAMAEPGLPRGLLHGDPFLGVPERLWLSTLLLLPCVQEQERVRWPDCCACSVYTDNMLCNAKDGSLAGFVDLEDVCVGPLLFDIACCASASCFRPDGAFDARRLRSLLGAYAEVRPLEAAEVRRFVDFMCLAMLCNASWRFKNVRVFALAWLPT
jgi:hypothetical protein